MLEDIESALGGLVGRAGPLIRTANPALAVHYADLGDLARVLPRSKGRKTLPRDAVPIGVGVAADAAAARAAALAEALERYAASMWRDEEFIVATADELGEDALDLDALPRCSDRELASPLCSWTSPRKRAPLRWVSGISLLSGRAVWIPAVMVYLGLQPAATEKFTLSNSSGCACHRTLAQALVTAICEVVERDAVALVWLQRLRLPRIVFDEVSPGLAPFVSDDAKGTLVRYLFDATGDLGIPTVYGVEVAEHDPKISRLVACATNLDPAQAVMKVVSDLASHRLAMNVERTIPNDPTSFTKSFEGCLYMADRQRRDAFAFLVDGDARRKFDDMSAVGGDDDAGNVFELVRRLDAHGIEAFAVDISTDEAVAAGMWVVRVVIPQLMPLTFNPNIRYLAHPRLYDAAARIGHEVHAEADVNPWPQPFG